MKVADTETGLTDERLQELLSYDPETGEFKWRSNRRGTARAGSVAGTLSRYGYRLIKIDGRGYFAHRLAWLYVYGRWPVDQIDHINTDKNDNRIANLREATGPENSGNQRKARAGSTTGLLGVSWYRRRNKFKASIGLSGKIMYLGYFRTAEEAHQAYLKAKRELHSFCTL